jgi:hypothetical protein
MNNKIIFYPPIQKSIKMNKFTVSITELILFTSCTISVVLYDSDTDIPIDNRLYKVEGQEYLAWDSNDQYIISFVKTKLQQESNN